jgi:hypothetical protein
LLQQLADAGCPLVVFDVHFQDEGDRDEDAALANAMRRQQKLVLMTDLADPKSPHLAQESIVPPHKTFVAVATNLGVGNAGVELLSTPRRLWPFPFTSELPSLPLVAARAAGVAVDESAGKRWLRYYGKAWDPWTYSLALSNNSVEYYRDRVVFIGQGPERANDPGYQELDKFSTPFTRWNSTSVGGVEILATTYLNLVNGDWLRRFAWPVELLILVLSGAALGGGLGYFRHGPATLLALGLAVGVLVVSVALTHLTNYWFPWLIIAGGQLPCALLRALLPTRPAVTARRPQPAVASEEVPAAKTVVINQPGEPIPNAPEYDVITPHIGEGGFGKVWIARNALGQWQALKAVYEAHFKGNRKAYEAEFNGLQKYKPISEKHPGLLRIDLVSRMKPEGYFYYVMELGDAMAPGWENRPQFYKTRDLESLRKQAYGHRLPPAECLRIVSVLAEALQFLHENGLTHRDIKPSNVIFVNACPKLADVGLVTNIKPDGVDRTLVGTPGYMPPPPERPGTVQADIFSLGMLLYVISTGREPELFPSLGTALVEDRENEGFMQLNAIILKACQPDLTHRYGAAAELLAAARQALRNLPA